MAGSDIVTEAQLDALVAAVAAKLNAAQHASPWPQVDPGSWYCPDSGTAATLALTLNKLYLVPFAVPRKVRLNTASFMVSTAGAAGAVIRTGLWGDNGSSRPGTLLNDKGTLATTSTGVKTTTSFGNTLNPNQLYWIGFAAQVITCTVRVRNGVNRSLPCHTNAPIMASPISCLSLTGVSGAFASNPTIAATEHGPTCLLDFLEPL